MGEFISIWRNIRGDITKSSLEIRDGRLIVVGALPHGAEITIPESEAKRLAAWLKESYKLAD